MSNIFNDLNKLVNTVQKVDKLLTEKPKRTRTKSVSLVEDELDIIYDALTIYYKNESDALDLKDKEELMYRISKLRLKFVKLIKIK
jgi:ABC-type bacteriocin/lantibiotic exporter with double-glycine peptidase domain